MGLIIPRNRLGYPGGNPRLNLSHPAAAGIMPGHFGMAAVAAGANFIDLATGKQGTVTGTVTQSLTVIGPAVKFTGSTGNYVTITQDTFTPGAVNMTTGAIAVYNTVTAGTIQSLYNVGSGQNIFNYNGDNGISFFNGATGSHTLESLVEAVANVPYFVGTSVNGTITNVVVRNLSTGQYFTAAGTPGSNIGVTSVSIGGGSGGQGAVASIAAVAYTPTYLTLLQLVQWSAAPWDLWYSPQTKSIINLVGKQAASTVTAVGNADGSASVAGVGASLFKGVGNADGTSSVAGVSASTAAGVGNADGVASVSGVSASTAAAHGNADGQASVSGVGASIAVAHGNADGQASVSGVGATLSGSSGHADGSASVSGVGASIATAAGHADGSSSASGVTIVSSRQPLPPLVRQRSYKHRFLGRSFDPQVVVEKDRPGPLRIIEFDAWMD